VASAREWSTEEHLCGGTVCFGTIASRFACRPRRRHSLRSRLHNAGCSRSRIRSRRVKQGPVDAGTAFKVVAYGHGCGHDFVDAQAAAGHEQISPFVIHLGAANGSVVASQVMKAHCGPLGATVEPFVLQSTPWVLLVGKQRVEQGCSFAWEVGCNPRFATARGDRVELKVIKNTPFLNVCDVSVLGDTVGTPVVPRYPIFDPVAETKPSSTWQRVRDTLSQGRLTREQDSPASVEVVSGADAGIMPVDPGTDAGNRDRPSAGAVPAAGADVHREDSDEDAASHEAWEEAGGTAQYRHTLKHLPTREDYDACRRGKTWDRYSKRGASRRDIKHWGDIVTCDHLCAGPPCTRGLDGEHDALVVKDVCSGFSRVYPVATKSETRVAESLAHCADGRRISLLYSDNAPEFVSASRELSVLRETSVPGAPKTNSLIERANQIVLGGRGDLSSRCCPSSVLLALRSSMLQF
jgi:hypothetical protein